MRRGAAGAAMRRGAAATAGAAMCRGPAAAAKSRRTAEQQLQSVEQQNLSVEHLSVEERWLEAVVAARGCPVFLQGSRCRNGKVCRLSHSFRTCPFCMEADYLGREFLINSHFRKCAALEDIKGELKKYCKRP
eukprot:TRINITY_DN7790_c0_g1_i15.p2 TRINITY_DN7790_c0_g1~~TRINITY_DN7790_c0_g1_i15.p2  ORF type:complete len:133 (-),score=25.27 TRINITY_DN7790_c0_g1_i15:94-492(-)